MSPAQVGCRLAHVQLWERIVREGVETALILEDDIDWDLNIHMISEQLSRQMAVSKLTSKGIKHDVVPGPYGMVGALIHVAPAILFLHSIYCIFRTLPIKHPSFPKNIIWTLAPLIN